MHACPSTHCPTIYFVDPSRFVCVLSHSVVPTLRPHRLQPAWLLCPWNSPGKNIGVGSHSFLQGIFPTQISSLGLLYCRQILYCLSQEGCYQSPVFYKAPAYPPRPPPPHAKRQFFFSLLCCDVGKNIHYSFWKGMSNC